MAPSRFLEPLPFIQWWRSGPGISESIPGSHVRYFRWRSRQGYDRCTGWCCRTSAWFRVRSQPRKNRKGAFWVGVTKDAVFPVVNINNPVISEIMSKGLTQDVFTKIFITGEIKTWGQAIGKTGDHGWNTCLHPLRCLWRWRYLGQIPWYICPERYYWHRSEQRSRWIRGCSPRIPWIGYTISVMLLTFLVGTLLKGYWRFRSTLIKWFGWFGRKGWFSIESDRSNCFGQVSIPTWKDWIPSN